MVNNLMSSKGGVMTRITVLLLAVLGILSMSAGSVVAQTAGLTVTLNAGFAGRFRDNTLTPLLVTVENNGDNFEGRVLIRPERSRGVTYTVESPISIAQGARQSFTLYVALRSFAESVRVELLTDDGLIAAEALAPVTAIVPRERLIVRVTDAGNISPDISGGGLLPVSMLQSDWTLAQLPDLMVGLDAVDVLMLHAVDTGRLTPDQRTALDRWVDSGGHLIITGGAGWQATAQGLESMLPVTVTSSIVSEDFTELAALAGFAEAPERSQAVVADASVIDGAQVLAATEDGVPLVTRKARSLGVVDYLSFDPTGAPFNRWDGMAGLWVTLLTSRDARPGWSLGLVNPAQAYGAIEILPGVNAVPEVLAMIGFLALYIVIIGPLNYLVLSLIRKRELAWITIPLLIGGFTAAAWAIGFNLRGDEIVLSRLAVVESYQSSDEARVRQMVGLLAPRRSTYSMSVDEGQTLRPLLRPVQSGFFGSTASPVRVVESERFTADDFAVDASFMAGFQVDAFVARPDIEASFTVVEGGEDSEILRGSIRNGTDTVLRDVALLARGGVLLLEGEIAPGAVRTVNVTLNLDPEQPVPASWVEMSTGFVTPAQTRFVTRGRSSTYGPDNTAKSLFDSSTYRSQYFYGQPIFDTGLDQASLRRLIFLSTFMIEQFNAPSRGSSVTVLAWSEDSPLEQDLGDNASRSVNTTLYLIEAATERVASSGTQVRVRPEEFTWLTIRDEGGTESTPNGITYFNEGLLEFRYIPPSDKRLEMVDELTILINRSTVPLSVLGVGIFDWDAGEYVIVELTGERTIIENPARFIGPMNAVQLRLERTVASGTLSIARFGVEQAGSAGSS
jgi:hypothetical protein